MKKEILLLILIASSVCVVAQQTVKSDENRKVLRGPYETDRFKDNWFVGIGAGINFYEGDYDNKASFVDRIAPALDISVGKWITPYSGIRMQYSGLKASGMTLRNGKFAQKPKDGYSTKDFNIVNFHVDYLWNLTNGFWGYNKERLWNLTPYAGISYLHASGNHDNSNELGISFGFLNTFRLTDKLDLTLEARQMLVKDLFDGIMGGKKLDGMTSLTVGVSYKLGKSGFKRAQLPLHNDVYTTGIHNLQNENKTLKEQNNLLNMQLETFIQQLAGQPEERNVATTVEKLVTAPLALYFDPEKSELAPQELKNLEFYVGYVMNMDEDAKFVLNGRPDNRAVHREANLRQAQNRVEYVYRILTEKYGMNPDRFIKKVEKISGNQPMDPVLSHTVIIEPVE